VSPLRLEGWRVRPSFTANGPTQPVTLLIDEDTLTQLAGVDVVAWQTPWSALTNVRVAQRWGTTFLSAHVDGRTFVWRTRTRGALALLLPFVERAGGRRVADRYWIATSVAGVLVAVSCFVGYLGYRTNGSSPLVRALRAVNLTFRDLPGSWNASTSSILQGLQGTPLQVETTNFSTTTTLPTLTSPYGKIIHQFQQCLGVSSQRDRMFGVAAQSPLYQVSSRIFTSSVDGGVQVASTTQYYPHVSWVTHDTAEMRRSGFGGCLANTDAELAAYSPSAPVTVTNGRSVIVRTFAQGFHVAGVASFPAPGVSQLLGTPTQSLFSLVATSGHYEVTMFVLANDWKAAQPLAATLANVVVAHITAGQGTAL